MTLIKPRLCPSNLWFILWVYSFELPCMSSTHCPEREPLTEPFIPGKTHRGICRAWGTKAQSKLRQKLHGDRMPTITHTKHLIDFPPYTLPAPAGLFSNCNKNCWLENSSLSISPESQPSSFVVHSLLPTQKYVQEVTAPHRYV